ncbi:MAG: V-type ATP synthase subunit D [candidate division WOR-3 bacterium]
MSEISPTRMNLLLKKKQVEVAKSGAELLKNKKDALLVEFMKMLPEILKKRRELEESTARAMRTLFLTLGVDGAEEVRSASFSAKKEYFVKASEIKLWGVKFPEIIPTDGRKSIISRGYSPLSITSRIDEAADDFEKLLDDLVKGVPLEIKMKRIGEEIKKTTRRVNALEQKIIPEIKEQISYIRRVLEDREREDKFRLKRLKAKRGK